MWEDTDDVLICIVQMVDDSVIEISLDNFFNVNVTILSLPLVPLCLPLINCLFKPKFPGSSVVAGSSLH